MKNLIFILFLATSCATLVNGPREQVSITTKPPGAVVTNGIEFGITPVTFSLKRAHDYVFIVLKPGYSSETIRLHRRLNNWIFGNIIGLSLIGTGIDTATGAVWQFDPKTITVRLVPDSENHS